MKPKINRYSQKSIGSAFCPGIHVHCCDGFCCDRCRSPGTSGGNGNLVFRMVPVLYLAYLVFIILAAAFAR